MENSVGAETAIISYIVTVSVTPHVLLQLPPSSCFIFLGFDVMLHQCISLWVCEVKLACLTTTTKVSIHPCTRFRCISPVWWQGSISWLTSVGKESEEQLCDHTSVYGG